MQLDLPTLMIMGSFVAVCAGAVLLIAWSQNRSVPALAIWGAADILTAGGIFALMLGWVSHQPLALALGGGLLVAAPGLMWKAARTLDGKPAPLLLALLGLIAVALAGGVPGLRNVSGSLSLCMSSLYMLATAVTLWLGRSERLAARWPFIVLTAMHAAVLSTGAYSTLNGSSGRLEVPPVMSLFGLIHFESIIFSLGTAVFMLALIKERNEAKGMMAARIDPLTGIANRAGFTESAERIVERCRREGAQVSVMMFDLDRFKAINDTHGHAVGDAVIRKFCELTVAALRPNDVFGRLGGEEFAVVLRGTGIEAAYVRADRIRGAFQADCRFVGNRQVNATVSCGVAGSLDSEPTLDALLGEADVALYGAKTEGRNRVIRAAASKLDDGSPTVIRVA